MVAQLVKNLPSMEETQVQSLDKEDHLEKGMATDSNILAWRIHGLRSRVGYSSWGRIELDTTELTLSLFHWSSVKSLPSRISCSVLSFPLSPSLNRWGFELSVLASPPVPSWLRKQLIILLANLRTLYGGGGLVLKSRPTLVTLWTVAFQAPLSMGFSRQEYWSGLPFPSPKNTVFN